MLVIEDDGRGFEAVQVSPGKLGLEIMHERITQIGASLTIDNRPRQGTQGARVWPAE